MRNSRAVSAALEIADSELGTWRDHMAKAWPAAQLATYRFPLVSSTSWLSRITSVTTEPGRVIHHFVVVFWCFLVRIVRHQYNLFNNHRTSLVSLIFSEKLIYFFNIYMCIILTLTYISIWTYLTQWKLPGAFSVIWVHPVKLPGNYSVINWPTYFWCVRV